MATTEQIIAVFKMFKAAYPRFAEVAQGSDEALDAWALELAAIPDDVLHAAARMCVRTIKFYPSIAEVLDMALEISRRVSQFPTALEAWQELQNAVGKVGQYRDAPEFRNPLIAEFVADKGWYAICMGNAAEIREEFEHRYNAEFRRAKLHAAMPPEIAALAESFAPKPKLLPK